MLPDRVSNPGPLTCESGALPTALRGPAKLPRSKSKFSGSRKLTLRYQLFEISIVEMERKTGTTSKLYTFIH